MVLVQNSKKGNARIGSPWEKWDHSPAKWGRKLKFAPEPSRRRNAKHHVAHLPQLYRICGGMVYVYKGPEGHSQGVHWYFYLAGRDPVGGFRTRKAALEQDRKRLATCS